MLFFFPEFIYIYIYEDILKQTTFELFTVITLQLFIIEQC